MKSIQRNNKIFFVLVLLMLWHAIPALGQHADFRVKGSVSDDKGNPMELVIVRAEGQAAGTMTGLNGRFSFVCRSADTVTIVFSMAGYQSKRRVLLHPRDSVTLHVQLQPTDKVLEGAVVKGHRVQSGSTQELKLKDQKLAPSATGNGVEEMIQMQSGVSTHNELSSQYNVRGGSFNENCVYLNGQEVFRPFLIRSGQQEGLSIINSDMVENVKFSSGGFESCYGDKMSSVLDITYRHPDRLEGRISGSLLGGSVYVGWGNKKFSWMNSVRYKTTRYLLSSLQEKGEYRPNFLDYQTNLSWRPNDRWSIDIIGNVSDNHYNFMPESRETKFGTLKDTKSFKVYFDGQEKDYFRTYYGSLDLTHNFSKRTSLSLLASAYRTQESETYDIQGEYWLNEATKEDAMAVGTYYEHARNFLKGDMASVGLRFKTTLGAHRLQMGLKWFTEKVRERADEWEMRDSAGYSIPHNPEKLQLYYNLHAEETLTSSRIEAYLQDVYRLATKWGHLTFNYGVRLTHWDWNGETLFSPRASVGLIPAFNDNFVFRFATGVYYQVPSYKELRDTLTVDGNTKVRLNKDIRSQRSIHFVLGGDYHFRMGNRPFKFTGELYYKSLSRLIPYNVNNVRTIYYGRNLSSGYVAGIDFKLFGEFVPGTDSWITLSLMKTNEKLNGKNLPLPTDQRYNVSLYFTDYFPGTDRWKLTLKGHMADGLPFGPPHTGREAQVFRAPAYKRVDLGMSYRLLNNENRDHTRGVSRYLRNVWVGLDCFNVFGINNVNSYYWVSDVTGQQYAVPNYLTGRQLNLRFLVEF